MTVAFFASSGPHTARLRGLEAGDEQRRLGRGVYASHAGRG